MANRGEPAGVLPGGRHVVDRAGPHHHQQAIVVAPKNPRHLAPAPLHEGALGITHGQLAHHDLGGIERTELGDAEIVGAADHEPVME